MHRLLRTVVTATAVIAVAPVAYAADLPVKASAPAPSTSDWTGLYAGINGGYGWANETVLGDTEDNPQGISPKGAFGGAQIGYNYQTDKVVLGVEADLDRSGISASMTDANFGDRFSSKLNWFGTVRGRLGYAFNPLLVYVTGGFAYGHIVTDVTSPSLIGAPYHYSGITTGYTLGGGVEYKLNSAWSVKVEYQYINLGTIDPASATGGTFSSRLTHDILHANAFHTVRLGLNYKFN